MERKSYGDIRVEFDQGNMDIFVGEEHDFLPVLREIGVRFNPKKGAFVIGKTYPSRQDAAVERLEEYASGYAARQACVGEGEYGPLKLIRPFEDAGFILVFRHYDKDVKDRLKAEVPGAVYMGMTRSWHVPFDSQSELQTFLKSL
jgi:hypothetical protein